ncbi:4-(cytidine 5'-diphospho)-2-C-methyl-D-erythritol kinase [Parasulfitobacter algicola]|uniref:4-diphosphocytidyl-2-C-methyl-D-erythritol kinase n=1 Tax=Parasulfitobacter algicola TaxID=2614809 RepID=A0ABX2ILT8_9RHOB|nr:4-(cytidine 5'-diphospho)-2-C-methyl-D-erythritol kinase [Sulfitobacter algicola]NSX53832.1 4-(cytidine 5'-diphospho)-2-C-methyl-D-erythritol kinase [Sulfitobacter algicola]
MTDKKTTSVKVFAPAKINLTLHITGQRDDGYHLIDSLVAFASVGDVVKIGPGEAVSLKINGAEGDGLSADADNLILKTADIFKTDQGASFTLIKKLPVASGIGGGSADAAAAFRGLVPLWAEHDGKVLSDDLVAETEALAKLGADIPMCLFSAPCRATGIGNKLQMIETFTPVSALLVNPRVAVSTQDVFKSLKQKDNAPMLDALPQFTHAADLAGWLKDQRNDLEAVAKEIAPVIDDVLNALNDTDECLIARMSGSGATCFALYPNGETSDQAAKVIRKEYPDWWVKSCMLGDQSARSMPKVS